jgi:hypothetical protein
MSKQRPCVVFSEFELVTLHWILEVAIKEEWCNRIKCLEKAHKKIESALLQINDGRDSFVETVTRTESQRKRWKERKPPPYIPKKPQRDIAEEQRDVWDHESKVVSLFKTQDA